MTAGEPKVLVDRKGPRGYVTINRPYARNALDPDGWRQLGEAFQGLLAEEAIRVVIVTGAGEEAFCSGADLKETVPPLLDGSLDLHLFDAPLLKPNVFWKPVIAAVRGFCLAGGMELLEATDIRVAAEDATFGLPEPRWGLVPAGGSLVRLLRQMPYCRAMEMLLTGGTLTASEALQAGLINKVVPSDQVMAEADRYAERLERNGPIALRVCKEATLRLLSVPYEKAFDLELELAQPVFTSEDAREGVRAFAAKRHPDFHGR